MKMNLTTSEKNRGLVRFLLMSLLLSILILPAHAQDRVTVSGQLTDSSQTPLIGASVIEKGTTNGVTTDADGRYQISVKPDGVIDFSFIGYKPQSLAVMNRTEINVTMEEDATMIGEVVAIGYGSQRKEDLSMAVSTVKVDDAARSRAADLGTLLQGRMPGVTIQQSGDRCRKRRSPSAAAARRATTTARTRAPHTAATISARLRATACWSLWTVSPALPTWPKISRRSPS